MERSVRYELLRSDDEDEAARVVNVADVATVTDAPPPIASLELVETELPESEGAAAAADTTEINMADAAKIPEPPSYSVATSLPSYEEAEESKRLEAEEAEQRQTQTSSTSSEGAKLPDSLLGTDAMFLCTFVFAFLFNWIGLLASLCLVKTIAGRMGALAGFGLSVVKWVAIIKHNNWAHNVADGDSWVWWMLIIMGLLIFFRGCMQYIRIKHQWSRLRQLSPERVYLYF